MKNVGKAHFGNSNSVLRNPHGLKFSLTKNYIEIKQKIIKSNNKINNMKNFSIQLEDNPIYPIHIMYHIYARKMYYFNNDHKVSLFIVVLSMT